MIDFFTRLDTYLNFKNLNDNKVTVETGISNGLIGKARKRGALSQENISKILYTYRDLSADWLLTGEGNMLKNSPKSDMPVAKKTEKGGIPLIPAEAIAGVMSGDSGTIMEYDCERYEVPLFKGAEFLISVKGSSMIPKYNSGDVVACKKVTMGNFFQWNKVYVLNTEQGDLIKRIFEGSSNDTLKLVSDNPKYLPFEINKSDIYNIAIVIGVIRLE